MSKSEVRDMLYTVSNRDIDNIKEAQKIGNKIDNGTITKPAIAIIKIMELMTTFIVARYVYLTMVLLYREIAFSFSHLFLIWNVK